MADPAPAVLDASALLAYLQSEQGSDRVEAHLSEGRLSTVNFCEILQKAIAHDVSVVGLADDLRAWEWQS